MSKHAEEEERLFFQRFEAHEANERMATLAEQMERYDGSLPSVFSAYNAGPHRIDAWKELPEYDVDEELFTERIPYRLNNSCAFTKMRSFVSIIAVAKLWKL